MVAYKNTNGYCETKKLATEKPSGLDETDNKSYDCNVNDNKFPKSSFVSFTRNSTARFQINTDLIQPQSIGLNVNTHVQYKPKKKFTYNDYINVVLFCLLMGHGALTYREVQCLKAEIEGVRNYIDTLKENLRMANFLYEQVQTKVQELEGKSPEFTSVNEEVHSVNKRETKPQVTHVDCSNSSRPARSVSRGKHSHCKNRNGCRCRCCRTSGPFSVHLKGALPEISVRDGGIIAPWYIDKASSGVFLLVDGVVGENRGIIEIVEEGLYFIYAQMYYLTSSSLNSYTINLQLSEEKNPGRRREDAVVAVCSAEAATSKLSELSCFTAVVRYLHKGDRIYITQRERNRRIIFRDNKSFLGFTLLNSPQGFVQ